MYQSLKNRLENQVVPLDTVEKYWLIFQILCAISQIHSKNVVHGDINP